MDKIIPLITPKALALLKTKPLRDGDGYLPKREYKPRTCPNRRINPYRSKKPRAVVRSDGKVYESTYEAAKELDVRPESIRATIYQEVYTIKGFSFKYLTYVYEPKPCPIKCCDGRVFGSKVEAALALGVNVKSIKNNLELRTSKCKGLKLNYVI